jgi:hypothetical protein
MSGIFFAIVLVFLFGNLCNHVFAIGRSEPHRTAAGSTIMVPVAAKEDTPTRVDLVRATRPATNAGREAEDFFGH